MQDLIPVARQRPCYCLVPQVRRLASQPSGGNYILEVGGKDAYLGADRPANHGPTPDAEVRRG
jgi:hypothetical protein